MLSGSVIGGGRRSVRAALFIGAMVAARHNPSLKALRDKLVVLVAVAGKLLAILNAVVRDHAPWHSRNA